MKRFNNYFDWLSRHRFGCYLQEHEGRFVGRSLQTAPGHTVLCIGAACMLPAGVSRERTIIQCESVDAGCSDVYADTARMPWLAHSIDTVLWLHEADMPNNRKQAAEEIYRVLKPGGRLVLTGMNAAGYWRLFYGRQPALRDVKPMRAHTAVRWLSGYGFCWEEGCFFGYGLPGSTPDGRFTRKLELAGNRWWPHLAAAYGLVFIKEAVPLTPLPSVVEKIKQSLIPEPLPVPNRKNR